MLKFTWDRNIAAKWLNILSSLYMENVEFRKSFRTRTERQLDQRQDLQQVEMAKLVLYTFLFLAVFATLGFSEIYVNFGKYGKCEKTCYKYKKTMIKTSHTGSKIHKKRCTGGKCKRRSGRSLTLLPWIISHPWPCFPGPSRHLSPPAETRWLGQEMIKVICNNYWFTRISYNILGI